MFNAVLTTQQTFVKDNAVLMGTAIAGITISAAARKVFILFYILTRLMTYDFILIYSLSIDLVQVLS